MQNARNALDEKMKTINALEVSLTDIESKEEQMKEAIEEKEVIIRKEL